MGAIDALLRAAPAQEARWDEQDRQATVKRFWKEVAVARGRRRLGDPARRPAGQDAGARAAGGSDRGAGRRDRRGMAVGRGDDRSARDAADGLRQCRDRPRRARPAARSRTGSRATPKPISPATAPKGRARWSTRAGRGVGRAARLGAAALRRRFRDDVRADPRRPAAGDGRAARPRGRGARSLPACRPVAAGDDRRLAGRGAGACSRSAITPEQAWDAVSIDERWQLEQWGADAEAEAALENRRRDFLAGGAIPGVARSLVLGPDQAADEGDETGLADSLRAFGGDDRPDLAPGIRPCRR